MSVKMTLVGPYEGKTKVLNGVQFKNGEAVLQGNHAENQGIIHYLGVSYQAYPDPSEELDDARARLAGKPAPEKKKKEPEGEQPDPNLGGDANKDPAPEVNQKLLEAVHALDPENDEHWTKNGSPAMAAVEGFYGSADITRGDIDTVAPGYNREAALEKKIAAEEEAAAEAAQ